MERAAKEALVTVLHEVFNTAGVVVVTHYSGLSVAQMTELRSRARQAGVQVRIVKNTLARRAVEGSRFECLKEHLVGPLAMAASSDPIAVAKVVSDFAKDHGDLKITVGAMDGSILESGEIQALAKLPGREELLAKLMGTMQAPIQKLVTTMNEVPTAFVRALAAVNENRSGAA